MRERTLDSHPTLCAWRKKKFALLVTTSKSNRHGRARYEKIKADIKWRTNPNLASYSVKLKERGTLNTDSIVSLHTFTVPTVWIGLAFKRNTEMQNRPILSQAAFIHATEYLINCKKRYSNGTPLCAKLAHFLRPPHERIYMSETGKFCEGGKLLFCPYCIIPWFKVVTMKI